jgi:hypothetical protein
MADFGMLDKAKQMKEQAAQKAAELKEQASNKAGALKESVATSAGGMKESVANKAGEMKEAVSVRAGEMKESALQAAADAKEASFNKVKEIIDDFNSALPVIRQAGYTVSEVDIAMGIPPKVSCSVTAAPDLTADRVEAVLAEHADKKFTIVLVKALFQAWKLQNAIHIVGMKPRNMGIELGLIPAVTVKFVPA